MSHQQKYDIRMTVPSRELLRKHRKIFNISFYRRCQSKGTKADFRSWRKYQCVLHAHERRSGELAN